MRVLCLLNGQQGWQTGIEYGLRAIQEISEIDFIYYQHLINSEGQLKTEELIIKAFNEKRPEILAIFHLGKYNFTRGFWCFLEGVARNATLVYDEGDMYGGFAKPVTRQMKRLAKLSTIVSIRGYGNFKCRMLKYSDKVIYTPHSNDIAPLMNTLVDFDSKQKRIVQTGNRIERSWRKFNIRIEGASERERYLKLLCNLYPGKVDVYGANWNRVKCAKGVIPFQQQYIPYLNSWFAFAYEHYPNEKGYFSNRLPIALACGCIYISHYNESYLDIFPRNEFFYMYRNKEELQEIMMSLFALDEAVLREKALSAISFYNSNLSPKYVWGNWFSQVANND